MNIRHLFYSRWTSFIGMLLCVSVLVFAAYLQVKLGLLPCPLCVLQRILLLLIGFTFLVGALYRPPARFAQRVHSGFILFFSGAGIAIAARHVWLTLQPPSQMTACSPTIEYMLENLPLTQTLKVMFLGSGDCAKVTYHLFALNIPQWTLIIFVFLFLFALVRYIVAKSD